MTGTNSLTLALKDNADLSDLLADVKPGDKISLTVTMTVKSKTDDDFNAAVTDCGDLEVEDEADDESDVSVKNSDDEDEDSPGVYVAKKDAKDDSSEE